MPHNFNFIIVSECGCFTFETVSPWQRCVLYWVKCVDLVEQSSPGISPKQSRRLRSNPAPIHLPVIFKQPWTPWLACSDAFVIKCMLAKTLPKMILLYWLYLDLIHARDSWRNTLLSLAVTDKRSLISEGVFECELHTSQHSCISSPHSSSWLVSTLVLPHQPDALLTQNNILTGSRDHLIKIALKWLNFCSIYSNCVIGNSLFWEDGVNGWSRYSIWK